MDVVSNLAGTPQHCNRNCNEARGEGNSENPKRDICDSINELCKVCMGLAVQVGVAVGIPVKSEHVPAPFELASSVHLGCLPSLLSFCRKLARFTREFRDLHCARIVVL